jgi:hypothetical protein
LGAVAQSGVVDQDGIFHEPKRERVARPAAQGKGK